MAALSISVAMCTFNGVQYLLPQLESIGAQDRPPDELVICDDGSSDGSLEVAKAFAGRSAFPVHLVVNENNLGSTKNFEKAISMCHGSIVALADQDDIWYRHKLSRIEKSFRLSTVVAAFSDADLIDDNSHPVGLHLWRTLGFDTIKQRRFVNGHALKVLIRHPVVTGAAMAFRRDLFGLMVPIPIDDIHDRWMSFLLAARGEFAIIPEPLMQYRRHREQQIGPGPLTLPDRIAQAKSRGTDAYCQEIRRFRELYNFLRQRSEYYPNAQEAQEEIERKILHLEHRTQLPRTKLWRIPGILRETVNGHYWRYSGGLMSLAKDLVIR